MSRMNSFLVHSTHIYLPMKMEQTKCSETSAYKLQTPGNYSEESIQQRFPYQSVLLRDDTKAEYRVGPTRQMPQAPVYDGR